MHPQESCDAQTLAYLFTLPGTLDSHDDIGVISILTAGKIAEIAGFQDERFVLGCWVWFIGGKDRLLGLLGGGLEGV